MKAAMDGAVHEVVICLGDGMGNVILTAGLAGA